MLGKLLELIYFSVFSYFLGSLFAISIAVIVRFSNLENSRNTAVAVLITEFWKFYTYLYGASFASSVILWMILRFTPTSMV